MALRTPPSWLQNASHPAENDRLTNQALYATTGVIGLSSLAVTQSAVPAMSVSIAAGWAAIVGDYQANQGVYMAYNDGAVTATITTANPTNPRIDRVCLTVNDSAYTGSLNNIVVNVVAGTPAASPSAPATPTNSISLATVAVAAGATTITNANITDTRVQVTTNLQIGDITSVAAGKGLTGGGTSGAVTLDLATTAKGDLVTGTGTTTAARLPVGTNNQVLIADSTVANGMKWGTTPSALNPVYSDVVPSASQTFTITNVTQSTTTMTYTTSAAHNLTTGMRVTVDGVIASSFQTSSTNPNADFIILAATPGGTTFTRTVATGTMSYTSGGRVYPQRIQSATFAKYVNSTWIIGNSNGMYAWSTDGSTWNMNYCGANLTNPTLTDVSWNGTTYVMVGQSSVGAMIVTNTTLASNVWTSRTTTFGATATGKIRSIVWAAGSVNKFVVVGASAENSTNGTAAAAYSSDGNTWTATTLGSANGTGRYITWDGTNFVVTYSYYDGGNGDYYGGVAYGTTGTSWSNTNWASGATYVNTNLPIYHQYNSVNSRYYIYYSNAAAYVIAYADLGIIPKNSGDRTGNNGVTSATAYPLDLTNYSYSNLNSRVAYTTLYDSGSPLYNGNAVVVFDTTGWKTWAQYSSTVLIQTHSLTSNGPSPNTLLYPISSSVNVPIPASSGVITSGGYSIGAWNGTNWLFVASGSNAYGPKVTLV